MTETLLEPATPPDLSERKRLLGRDVASAYLLTFSRVAAWATISAIVYRHAEVGEFVLFVLLRSTVTLFSYTSLGLAPAMIRWFAMAQVTPVATVVEPPSRDVTIQKGNTLSYQTPLRPQDPENVVMSSGFCLCILLTAVGLALGACYLWQLDSVHTFPIALTDVAFTTASYFVAGTLLRLLSEPMSAVLQSHRAIYIDNILLAGSELLWIVLALGLHLERAWSVTLAWVMASLALLVARRIMSSRRAPQLQWSSRFADRGMMKAMLGFGVTIVIAQIADFLYAPTDFILINRLLGSVDTLNYAPAVQLDSALLLLVAAPAAVIYPRVAAAHAAGNLERIRRLYFAGTLASLLLLASAATVLWLSSPLVFRLWLGETMPGTSAILPLVLIHTVIGGSSAVGRSILLGIGKAKAVTVSVLIAGAANVGLSALFASVCGLGLRGIVLGTIVVVVARCGLWMPWYVHRSLSRSHQLGAAMVKV